MAKTNFKAKVERVKLNKAKAGVKRYKVDTRIKKADARVARKVSKLRAKNELPLEKAKLKANVQKHAIWASTATSLFGKGTNTASSIAKQFSNNQQNVDGGLQNTQKGRNSEEEEDQDSVDGGGVVY